jgi:hypothetical protein
LITVLKVPSQARTNVNTSVTIVRKNTFYQLMNK